VKEKKAHIFERDPENYYTEPSWCSERLFDVERFVGPIHDPACGSGRILDAAMSKNIRSSGADIIPRRGDIALIDFMDDTFPHDNIVTNPPFGREVKGFISHALKLVKLKAAFLMPTVWMNSKKTGEWLETTPLRRVHLLSPRPSMPPGKMIEAGMKPGNGTVDFCWMVFEIGYDGRPEIRWLRR